MTTIDRDDLHNLGPVVRDPDTDRRAALVIVAHLGHDAGDVLEMLELGGAA